MGTNEITTERKNALPELPREKLIKSGPSSLKNSELLAIILNNGTRKEKIFDLARRILQEYGPQAVVREDNVEYLMETLELSSVKACQIVACFELGRRFFQDSQNPFTIHTPDDVYHYLEEMYKLKKETLRALYLNTRNQLIHDEVISIGTLNANLVHPREVLKPALEYSAAGLIVVHNHPSGDPEPSYEDIKITRQIYKASKIMAIELLDHIIVGKKRFVSLRERKVITQ